MIDEQGFKIWLGLLAFAGLLSGFILWAFRLIPAWGIAAGTVGVPVAVVLAVIVLSRLNTD